MQRVRPRSAQEQCLSTHPHTARLKETRGSTRNLQTAFDGVERMQKSHSRLLRSTSNEPEMNSVLAVC